MYEVECKVRADHERVRTRLADLDATELGTVRQEDTYFDAPHRSFASTDEALRIRHESRSDGDQSVLTYKGPKVDSVSKTRKEAETAVNDENALREILDELGFDAAATVGKTRRRFRLDDCVVSLDSVEGLGQFVEVEYSPRDSTVVDSDAGIETARESVTETVASLGLESEDSIRTSYLGLLLDAGSDS